MLISGRDHFFLKNCGTEVVDEVEEELATGRRTIFTDRIRATMLFTDIVGSTALAASIGDEEWDRKIGEHNELLRRLVVSNGGEECKHTGDGFFSVFEDTPDAVRFALAAVTAVEPLGLELCAGAHVGDVTRMDESDLSGVAVHLARRLCERAEGGRSSSPRTSATSAKGPVSCSRVGAGRPSRAFRTDGRPTRCSRGSDAHGPP